MITFAYVYCGNEALYSVSTRTITLNFWSYLNKITPISIKNNNIYFDKKLHMNIINDRSKKAPSIQWCANKYCSNVGINLSSNDISVPNVQTYIVSILDIDCLKILLKSGEFRFIFNVLPNVKPLHWKKKYPYVNYVKYFSWDNILVPESKKNIFFWRSYDDRKHNLIQFKQILSQLDLDLTNENLNGNELRVWSCLGCDNYTIHWIIKCLIDEYYILVSVFNINNEYTRAIGESLGLKKSILVEATIKNIELFDKILMQYDCPLYENITNCILNTINNMVFYELPTYLSVKENFLIFADSSKSTNNRFWKKSTCVFDDYQYYYRNSNIDIEIFG